jgi:hypothetical protein
MDLELHKELDDAKKFNIWRVYQANHPEELAFKDPPPIEIAKQPDVTPKTNFDLLQLRAPKMDPAPSILPLLQETVVTDRVQTELSKLFDVNDALQHGDYPRAEFILGRPLTTDELTAKLVKDLKSRGATEIGLEAQIRAQLKMQIEADKLKAKVTKQLAEEWQRDHPGQPLPEVLRAAAGPPMLPPPPPPPPAAPAVPSTQLLYEQLPLYDEELEELPTRAPSPTPSVMSTATTLTAKTIALRDLLASKLKQQDLNQLLEDPDPASFKATVEAYHFTPEQTQELIDGHQELLEDYGLVPSSASASAPAPITKYFVYEDFGAGGGNEHKYYGQAFRSEGRGGKNVSEIINLIMKQIREAMGIKKMPKGWGTTPGLRRIEDKSNALQEQFIKWQEAGAPQGQRAVLPLGGSSGSGIMPWHRKGNNLARQWVQFGPRMAISKRDLQRKVFTIRRLASGKEVNGLPQRNLTPKTVEAIVTLARGYAPEMEGIDDEDKAWLEDLIEKSALQRKPRHRVEPKPRIRLYHTKAGLLERLKVLIGELSNGNDSPLLANELLKLRDMLKLKGWLKAADFDGITELLALQN